MSQPNHLGTQRKRWKLSYGELAQLLGYGFESAVYRAEKNERPPTIKFALGCEIVFGVPLRELFPALYVEIEEAVMRRATKLDQSLRDDFSHEANVKRELLRLMAERADNQNRP